MILLFFYYINTKNTTYAAKNKKDTTYCAFTEFMYIGLTTLLLEKTSYCNIII